MNGHSLRIRPERWKDIKAKAWEMGLEIKETVTATDLADAILYKGIKGASLKDLEKVRAARKEARKQSK